MNSGKQFLKITLDKIGTLLEKRPSMEIDSQPDSKREELKFEINPNAELPVMEKIDSKRESSISKDFNTNDPIVKTSNKADKEEGSAQKKSENREERDYELGEWVRFVYVGKKRLYLTQQSLNIFPLSSKFRYQIIRLVEWNDSLGNQINNTTEPIFAALFTLEAVLKIIAFGFLFDSKCYLREAWNWLDFIVVVTALLNFLPGMQNISGIRTFRLFRPLRSLQALPNMKILVNTLLTSIIQIAHILVLAMFYFAIFAIFGINLWSGALNYRCRLTPEPVDGDWLTVPNDNRVCGTGHECEIACGSLFDYNQSVLYNVNNLYRDSQIQQLNYGYTNFDNFFYALLTIFQCTTLEGWSYVMYIIKDYYGYPVAAIYFVLCVTICSYFLLNLTVAVMLQNYSQMKTINIKIQRIYQKYFKEKDVDIDQKRRLLLENYNKNKEKKSKMKLKDKCKVLYKELIYKQVNVPNTPYYQKKLPRIAYLIFYQYKIYLIAIRVICVANLIVLGLDSHPQSSDWFQQFEHYTSLFFTIILFMDSIVKLVAFGCRDFIRDKFNIFDAIVLIVCLIFYCLGYDYGNALSVFRGFRLLRIINMVYSWESLKILIDSIMYTLSSIGNFIILLAIMIYVYALLGMQFFGGMLRFDEQGNYDPVNGKVPIANFDTLNWAIVTIFQILICDRWTAVMYDCMRAIGWYTCIYFISLIVFGHIILLNLFLAIMLGHFEEASILKREYKLFQHYSTHSRNNSNQNNSINNRTHNSPLTHKLNHVYPDIKVIKEKPFHHQSTIGQGRRNMNEQLIVTRLDSLKNNIEHNPPRKSITIKDQQSIQRLGLNSQQTIKEDDEESQFQDQSTPESPQKEENKKNKNQSAQQRRASRPPEEKDSSYDSSFTDDENTDSFKNEDSNSVKDNSKIFPKSVKSIGSDNLTTNRGIGLEELKAQYESGDDFDNLKIPIPSSRRNLSKPKKQRSSSLITNKLPKKVDELLKDTIMAQTKSSPLKLNKIQEIDNQKSEIFKLESMQSLPSARGLLPSSERNMQTLNDKEHTNDLQIKFKPIIPIRTRLLNYVKRSSLCIFHKRSRLRLTLIKLVLPMKYHKHYQINTDKSTYLSTMMTTKTTSKHKKSMKGYEYYLQSDQEDANTTVFDIQSTVVNYQTQNDTVRQQWNNNRIDTRQFERQMSIRKLQSFDSQRAGIREVSGYQSNYPMADKDYSSEQSVKINDQIQHDTQWSMTKSEIRRRKETGCWAWFKKVKPSKVFDNIVLSLIIMSCVVQALDNPLNDPNTYFDYILKLIDMVFTVMFVIEALIKIITLGFISTSLRGVQPYLFVGWNIIDLLVVTTSVIDMIYDQMSTTQQSANLKALKALRALRALRPLRVINRNEGLKLVVDSLFSSMKSIGNLLVVLFLFMVIFAILGIHLFKGQFYECDVTMLHQMNLNRTYLINMIDTKFDCLLYGGSWVNSYHNFDNIGNALLTLFELMTTEGWLSIMSSGIDARGIDLQPKNNYSQYWAFYFIFYIIVGHMFIINIFVAVVLDNFNIMKEKISGFGFMTEQQKQWVELQRYFIRQKLLFKKDIPSGNLKFFFYNLINKRAFDLTIMGCIILNTILMTIRYFGMPRELSTALDIGNYIFAAIFNLEMIFKLIGLGTSYFRSNSNRFDFIVVLLTDLGIIISLIQIQVNFASVAAVIRGVRIIRLFSLMKASKNIKVLLNTVIYILPTLANIGSLIFLLLFIYTILGMNLFSSVMPQKQINDSVNFQNFGQALMVLARCATGENWNDLMHEFANSDGFQGQMCIDSQSYDSIQAIGFKGCGNKLSYIYFTSYMIIMSMIVLNLFIAAVIEGFSSSNYENSGVVTSEHYKNFLQKWSDYDKGATGWIDPKDLAFLIYDLERPLGRKNEYEQQLKNKIENQRMRSSNSGANEKEKYFILLEKNMVLPQSTILKILSELDLPLYDNYKVHFKDVCLRLARDAIRKALGEDSDFDQINEKYERRIDGEWIKQHKSLGSVVRLPINTGMHWAGLFIYKMIKKVREKKKNKELLQQKELEKKVGQDVSPRKAKIQIQRKLQKQKTLSAMKFHQSTSRDNGQQQNQQSLQKVKLHNESKPKVEKSIINSFHESNDPKDKQEKAKKLKDTERSTWWQDSSTQMQKWLRNQEKRKKQKDMKEKKQFKEEVVSFKQIGRVFKPTSMDAMIQNQDFTSSINHL